MNEEIDVRVSRVGSEGSTVGASKKRMKEVRVS